MEAAGHQAMTDFLLTSEGGNQDSNSEDESDSELHSEFRKQMRRRLPRLLSDNAKSPKEDEVDNFGLESITQGWFQYKSQPLYSTIVGVQDKIHVSYPNCAVFRENIKIMFALTILGPALIYVISKTIK